MERKILRLQQRLNTTRKIANRIEKGKENSSKYLQDERDKNILRLDKYIAKYGADKNNTIIGYVTEFRRLREAIDSLPKVDSNFDTEYEHDADKKRLIELKEKLKKCRDDCEKLTKEVKELDDFEAKKTIENITLNNDKKLIDLLIHRILDPSHDWKIKIDTLINIPTSLKGEGFLRGGDYFEALFQLAIAIGAIKPSKDKYVRFYDIHKYKELHLFNNYLYNKTIKNSGGGEQGISDISFELSSDKEFSKIADKSYECGSPPSKSEVIPENTFYFISVKGYKKEKSIKDEYDIPLLDQQLNEFPDLNKYIIVCVRDKPKFMENLTRLKIDFLKRRIGNYVIGYNEVIEAFTQFRINFFNKFRDEKTIANITNEIYKIFPNDVIYQQPLNLYFHQELVVKSLINRIQEVNNPTKPHFLCVGVLPRGGKSFIAGGIINNHKKIRAKEAGYNVLFLTSAVSETRDQFSTDLIDKFSDFRDFQFIDVVNRTIYNDKPNKFYFISRQLASQPDEGKIDNPIEETAGGMLFTLKEKLGSLPPIDIVFFDEAHIGITSTTVRRNFQKAFDEFKVPIVLMTATYKKPAIFLDSTKDLFVWDLQDIKDMKSLPLLTLPEFIDKKPDVLERYPINAVEILARRLEQGETLINIAKPYMSFPNPNFISLTFTPDTITHLKSIGEGYDFTKAFELNVTPDILANPSKYLEWHTMIRNREDAVRLRQFLTPEQDLRNEDEIKTPFLQNKERKYRALNQIFSIAQKNGSRPMQGKPFSILMFLPFGFGNRGDTVKIGELCRVWASFMLNSEYWKKNFVFLTLSTYNNPKYKPKASVTIESAVKEGLCNRQDHPTYSDLKQLILEVEKEALRQEKGLVILSGDVAKMGISLKCVDIVFLLSHKTDADDIIQKMYRALTDDPPMKKDGFIVDLNLKRIITAMFDYDLEKDKMRIKNITIPTVSERLNKVFDLCNWGQDSFIEDHPEMDFNAIMNEIKTKVLGDLEHKILDRFNTKFEQIEKLQIELIKEDTPLYENIKNALEFTVVNKKDRTKKPTVMAMRGSTIPESTTAPVLPNSTSVVSSPTPAPAPTPMRPMLDESQIQEKMIHIIKTFVNSMVIKSAEPWTKSLNLVSLLNKYESDKLKLDGTPKCICSFANNCTKTHDNLYESVFCDIRNYALIYISEDKVQYNIDIHNKIMGLVEDVFKNSSIFVEWNIYIENLLKELKLTTMRGGHRKTRKISRS
jgi:hypothetical protein